LKKWLNKSWILFVDILLPIVAILFTLLVEGKLSEYISYTKEHPLNSIGIMVTISLILAGLKIYHEYNKKNLQEELELLGEENKFLIGLISEFKYQISKPLEDKLYEIFRDLKFDGQYRITVYTHTAGRFFSIGRYSENPNYKKFGRIAIRDKNELIFKAWENEELTETVHPNQKLNMRSVKISIKYLYEKNDTTPKKDRFGIIVFETTKNKENKIKNGNLDNAVEKVQNFFNEQWHIKQNLNFAMQEGL
jgi:hypothetical protein